jgi:pyruvate/2-oxoglutarate dehydrogenase complex dihydrolipoamide dehydrogenase (E3) component
MANISSEQLAKRTDFEEYDLVVFGSGAGGKLAAWTYAKEGQRVAVIERKYIGGSCPNIACLPSKSIIHSAKVASYFGRAQQSPFYVLLADAMKKEAEKDGVSLQLSIANQDLNKQLSDVEDFITKGVNPIVISSVDSKGATHTFT